MCAIIINMCGIVIVFVISIIMIITVVGIVIIMSILIMISSVPAARRARARDWPRLLQFNNSYYY